MAAVYTVEGGRTEKTVEELSVKNKQADVKKTVASPLPIQAKLIKVEQSSEDEDSSHAEPTPTKRHPETAVMDAAPAIAIKEERIEDDEYVQIKLVDVEERNQNKEIERDNESVDGDWLFRCVDCGEGFGQREAYLEHQREHIHDGPIVCLDSDAQWNDLLVSEDGGRRTLCCAVCGREFSSSRGFFTHQLKHRNEALKQEPGAEVAVPKQRLFECEYCGKSYSSIGLCLNHQRSHKQASKSVFHQLAHLKKKSFQCPTCGRCYSRASALDAHRRCHEVKLVKSRSSGAEKSPSTQENPVVENGDAAVGEVKKHEQHYECHECGRAFSTAVGLSTHQRFTSHSKCSEIKLKEDVKKPFSCSECDKCFLTNTALAIHQRWHIRRAKNSSSGQSFSCEECGKDFTSLTFLQKHQRLVHSAETPAKSFLHQVCQLKKKAFECQDCGRRFSRATALQSHQLCHTDVFGDAFGKATQKPVTPPTSLSPPQKLYLCDKENPESFAIGALVYSQETPQTNQVGGDLGCNEADEHAVVDENEIDGLIVEVISVSGSDDSFREDHEPEPLSESKTEPEMGCDSNQEAKKETVPQLDNQLNEMPLPLKSKTDADIGIDNEAKQVDGEKSPPKKTCFDCPECGRIFGSPNAIRCHRQWHRRPMGRAARVKNWNHTAPKQAYLKKCLFKCGECGKESTTLGSHHNHMRQHEDPKPYKSLLYQLAGLQKKNFKCEVCGMRFSRASALQSHQQHHTRPQRTHKCAHCEKAYSSYGALCNHRKACHSGQLNHGTTASIKKEVFNPRKTLLGPKVYHCEQCGKGFWSFGAFSQHKQNQRCTEVRENSDTSVQLAPVNGHTHSISKRATCPICGKRFRHRGILACHMKRHRSRPQMNHTCNVCGKSYRMLTCFLKHQLVHDTEGVPPPVKSFQHQMEQLEKNTYGCPDCGKKFSRAMALQFHMRSHGYETGYPFFSLSKSEAKTQVFQCSYCPVFFPSDAQLQDHLGKKHSGCLSEVTEENSGLAQHASEHPESSSGPPNRSSDGGKYKCKDCGRSFSVVGALNFHKRIHRKSQPAVAVSCAPVSVVQETKSKEEGNETKGPYICAECGRSFGTNSALGTHRRWHTDKKFASTLSTGMPTSRKNKTVNGGPYRCNICGKGFFYYCVLRRHQMHHPESEAHTQPRSSLESTSGSSRKPSKSNLSCPKCEKSFPRSSILATHYQTHHTNVPECIQCNLRFSSEGAKQKHHSQVHSNEECGQHGEPDSKKLASVATKRVKLRSHGCPDCSKRFSKARGLRAHRWQMHRKNRKTVGPTAASKSFVCTACEKRYSSQGALYNHRKVCTVTKSESKPVEAPVQDKVQAPSLPEHTYKWLFKCHKCGKAFPSLERLEAHKDMAKSRPYCCALCCRGYWTESQLQQHLVWHDEVRRRLPADLRYRLSTFSAPNEAVPNSEDCATHYLQDMDQTTASTTGTQSPVEYKCPHCEETFLNFLALQQHQNVHSVDDPYRCSLCPRTFSQIHELIDHHQECMSEKKEQNENGGGLVGRSSSGNGLTCIDCGITFSREMELHQHYILHASVKLRSMRCQDCGQQFIRWEAFKIHLRQHEHEEEEQRRKKVKKVSPVQAGKKVKKAEPRLDEDKKGEVGEDNDEDEAWFSGGWEVNPSDVFKVRPRVAMLSEEEKPVYSGSNKVYACAVCGKVYSYLESFKNHQKMHVEKVPQRDLTCPVCAETFHRQASLAIHMKSHSKKVSEGYKCNQCNKFFHSHQTWMAHKVIHKRKPFWCLSCAKGFKDAKGLDRHLLGHDLKRHKCDLCPKAFRVPAELRYHRNTHTGAKPFICQLCNKTFSQLGNLITHRKKHVGVYKAGSQTPIGGKPPSGGRRVTELKKLIVMAMDDMDTVGREEGVGPEEEAAERDELEDESDKEEQVGEQAGEQAEAESESEEEVVEREEGDLECFECGSWFSQESELHLHYMKHASGEL